MQYSVVRLLSKRSCDAEINDDLAKKFGSDDLKGLKLQIAERPSHFPIRAVWYPSVFKNSGRMRSPGCSGTLALPRTRVCPVCSPVMRTEREGAQTVLPA